MSIQTAWVKPPKQIAGLDHLGVQAPCINIYGKMLPGITNVTDRAKYYSFYPWLVWALKQDGMTYGEEFIKLFRRADCLFTLIAHRHADISADSDNIHAWATIGSANINQHIKSIQMGNAVQLSDFAHSDDRSGRYFKNKMGGLGQYYLGMLSELGIMDGTVGSGIKYTNEIGEKVALAFDAAVDREMFLATIKIDTVEPGRLDELSMFCPCQLLSSSAEAEILRQLFFVQGLFKDPNALSRRHTLQTLIYLTEFLSDQNKSLDLQMFRGCIYSGCLPDNTPIAVPDRLKPNLNRWGIYGRNELLSIAVQGLFFAMLDDYFNGNIRLDTEGELVAWFVSRINGLKWLGKDQKFDSCMQSIKNKMPDIGDWENDSHEIQLMNRLHSLGREGCKSLEDRVAVVDTALRSIMTMASREKQGSDYTEIGITPDYLSYYPINLTSFLNQMEHEFPGNTMEVVLQRLLLWTLNTHFTVALRKLRGQSQSTFRIRPSERGLEIPVEPVIPVFTSPRFNQAIRILEDIGALKRTEDNLVVTQIGHQLKDIADV